MSKSSRSVSRRTYSIRRRLRHFAAIAIAFAGFSSVAPADQLSFDDFEGLTMQPYGPANAGGPGDGTDFFDDFATLGWTRVNDHTPAPDAESAEQAYNGWTVMDVASWTAQQGGQSRTTLGLSTRNSALVADPDAWDDFNSTSDRTPAFYNSRLSQTFDLTGSDLSTLQISFDWELRHEDPQRCIVDVSFDGGATWQELFNIGPGIPNGRLYTTVDTGGAVAFDNQQRLFVAGTDFDATSPSLTLRFNCIEAQNDWWFAVDNISVSTNNFSYFEDFEGLDMLPFTAVQPNAPVGDGTDYSQDIPNWTIDNEGFWDTELRMYTRSAELAFDGFAAVDSESWRAQQGGQARDQFLWAFSTRNTILVADPDAHDDFDVELPDNDPNKSKAEFNSFISREYDMSSYDNTSVRIELSWESRLEPNQRGLIEVSFDGGLNWVALLDVDSADPAKLAEFNDNIIADGGTLGVADTNDVVGSFDPETETTTQVWQFGGADSALPATNSSSMIFRIGCINAQNNWWFAVDNIRVEADPQSFFHGDANGDGAVDTLDIDPFVLALLDPPAFAAQYPGIDPAVVLDFNADGIFDTLDIDGFVFELLN